MNCDLFLYFFLQNLFSVLMAAPKRSIYHGALFIFDIAIPENFPVDHPIVSYVSYATKLNPILKDQDFSVRPFSQCLTQTKHNLNNGNSSPSNSEIRPEGSLHDVITSIYSTKIVLPTCVCRVVSCVSVSLIFLYCSSIQMTCFWCRLLNL